ncbi:MAG: hypothetical protein J6Z04_05255 [Clostridia bacterium]|nr:hypothetical protein [Clostridia bacterium]
MFANLTKNQKLKLIGSFAATAFLGFVVVLVVFLYLNPSLGWFSTNRTVNGNGVGVEVGYDDFYVNAIYYQYDPKESAVVSSSDLSDIQFNPYDLVFRSRNRYTPVIAALKMTGNDLLSSGSLTIRINRNTTADKNGYVVDENTGRMHLTEYFTSIMRVTPYVGAAYYSSTAETLYANVDSAVNYEYARSLTGNVDAENGQPQSLVFTDVTMNGDLINTVEKEDYIDIEISYEISDFVWDNGVLTLIVYLYITYDEGGLLGIYQKTTETGSISAGGDITDQSIRFQNDLFYIKVTRE